MTLPQRIAASGLCLFLVPPAKVRTGGAPKGRLRCARMGSLPAPRLAAWLPPLSPLTARSAGDVPAIETFGIPAKAGGEEAARGGTRCSGREGLSPPLLGRGSHLSRLSSGAATLAPRSQTVGELASCRTRDGVKSNAG